MDNSANPTTPASQSVTSAAQDSSKNKNSWIKYFSAELLIILAVMGVVAFVIFKPFNLLVSSKPPKDMTKSIDANGKVHYLQPATSAPTIVTVKITDAGFVPSTASASGNILLQFQNNTIMPAEVEFSTSSIAPQKVGPNITSNLIALQHASSFKFHLKSDSSKSGSLTIN